MVLYRDRARGQVTVRETPRGRGLERARYLTENREHLAGREPISLEELLERVRAGQRAHQVHLIFALDRTVELEQVRMHHRCTEPGQAKDGASGLAAFGERWSEESERDPTTIWSLGLDDGVEVGTGLDHAPHAEADQGSAGSRSVENRAANLPHRSSSAVNSTPPLGAGSGAGWGGVGAASGCGDEGSDVLLGAGGGGGAGAGEGGCGVGTGEAGSCGRLLATLVTGPLPGAGIGRA